MDLPAKIGRLTQRLGFRIAALLTIALLPVGLIAMVQTRQVAEVAQDRAELTLLALTERAVTADRILTQRALGSARALATVMPALAGDEAACVQRLRDFVNDASTYSFAGFVPVDGLMRCSSTGEPFDFSDWPGRQDRIDNPRVIVSVNVEAPLSGTSVLIVSHPVFDGGDAFLGYVSLSVPTSVVQAEMAPIGGMDLVIFTREGELVGASLADEAEDVADVLPPEIVLTSLVSPDSQVFNASDAAGRSRTYAVVPFVEDRLFALGSFSEEGATVLAQQIALPAWVFPLLMWGVSLVVAYAAIHRLVIRHVRALSRRMREFTDRRVLPERGATDAPLELAHMEEAFDLMAEGIVREEAEAENALHRQRVLLKEVHHRVKNNLQLISSIINMQLRELTSPEAAFVLERVQDRVLGLAAVHRNLYQATDYQVMRADSLVDEITGQMMGIGAFSAAEVDLSTDLQEIYLYPDQAVPLCMFLTEALTNALKYIGRPAGGGRPWVRVALRSGEEGVVDLLVENSAGEARVSPIRDPSIGSGLGRRLLDAFARQLDGELEHDEGEERYLVTLRFRTEGFRDEAGEGEAAPDGVAA